MFRRLAISGTLSLVLAGSAWAQGLLAPHGADCDVCASHTPYFVTELMASVVQEQGNAEAPPAAPPEDPNLARDIKSDEDLGAEVHKEIVKQVKFVENPEMVARVTKIGETLAAIANARMVDNMWGEKRHVKLKYQFFVIDEPDVNAFSVPGGYIYFYRGLVEDVESDHELAGVMAHEIAHASFRHVAELRKRQERASLVSLPLLLAAILGGGEDLGNLAIGAQALVQALSSGWSVEAETSADLGGVQYMMQSSYNATGLLTFMERMAYNERFAPIQSLGIYRTHPPSRERVQFMRAKMATYRIPIQRSLVTTSMAARVEPEDNGGLKLSFGKMPIHVFRGDDSVARADDAEEKLNRFFDSEPTLVDLDVTNDGIVRGSGRRLFEVKWDDREGTEEGMDSMIESVRTNLQRALFDFNYRTAIDRSRSQPAETDSSNNVRTSGP